MTAQFYYKAAKKKRYFLLRVITMFLRMILSFFPSDLPVFVRPPNTNFSPSAMPTLFDISIIIGVMIGVLFNSVESKYA